MSTLSTTLAAILGIVFVAAGIPKISGQQRLVDEFKRWGYASAIRVATGIVELLAGVLLIAGIAVPAVAVTGVMLVIFVMLGALATHGRARDPIASWLAPVVLLALAIALAVSLLPD